MGKSIYLYTNLSTTTRAKLEAAQRRQRIIIKQGMYANCKEMTKAKAKAKAKGVGLCAGAPRPQRCLPLRKVVTAYVDGDVWSERWTLGFVTTWANGTKSAVDGGAPSTLDRFGNWDGRPWWMSIGVLYVPLPHFTSQPSLCSCSLQWQHGTAQSPFYCESGLQNKSFFRRSNKKKLSICL